MGGMGPWARGGGGGNGLHRDVTLQQDGTIKDSGDRD